MSIPPPPPRSASFLSLPVLFLLLGALSFALLYSLSSILIPFIIGFFGAYILNGPVNRLAYFGVSRGIASAIVLLSAIIVLILLSAIVLPYLNNQLILFARRIPIIVDNLFSNLRPLLEKISDSRLGIAPSALKGQLTSRVGDILSWAVQIFINVLTNGLALANFLSSIVLTPIILFYFLKDWPTLLSRIRLLLPPRYAKTTLRFIADVHMVLSAYGRGQLKVSLILMVLYGLSLWLSGLSQGILLGALMGVLSFVPYVGMITGFGLTLATALVNLSSWSGVGFVALCFLVIAGADAYIITPRLIGTKVGLHPVWTIFALLAGGTWFGLFGILIALPVAAVLGVGVRWIISSYLTSSLYRSPRPLSAKSS